MSDQTSVQKLKAAGRLLPFNESRARQAQTTVTERDRRLVEHYLGAFLLVSLKAGPNSAVADNARRAAEAMVAEQRERCAKIAETMADWSEVADSSTGYAIAERIRSSQNV